MLDLEILFARYSFEIAMLDRCLQAGRAVAPYAERASHFLRQITAQVQAAAELETDDVASTLGEMLAFDPDLALEQLELHVARHHDCLERMEIACLSTADRLDLTGPACLEIVASSHRVLDAARGVLWAARTYGIVD